MREIEKSLNKRIWAYENREKLSLKGCGLINFQSRLKTSNPISKEIEGLIETRVSYRNNLLHSRTSKGLCDHKS